MRVLRRECAGRDCGGAEGYCAHVCMVVDFIVCLCLRLSGRVTAA